MFSTLLKKILFVFVFCIYSLIFYLLCYYTLHHLQPEALLAPDQLTTEYIAAVIAIFTLIVSLAYIGASYVVLGSISSASSDAPTIASNPQVDQQKADSKTKSNLTKDDQSPKSPAKSSPSTPSNLPPRPRNIVKKANSPATSSS